MGSVFCFLPLWNSWLNEDSSPKKVFISGWWTQLLLTLIGFHWVANTAVEFGHLPWAIGILILFGFGLFAHLHVPLAGLLWSLAHKRWPMKKSYSVLLLVFITWALENTYPMLFPWNFGYPWIWAHLPAIQWADVIGFQGLSLLSLAFNGMLLVIWKFEIPQASKFKLLTAGIIIFFALNLTGNLRKERWGTEHATQTTPLFVVQANIGNFEKYLAEHVRDIRRPILNTYMRLMQTAANEGRLRPGDTVIWPETAFPDMMEPNPSSAEFQNTLKNFLKAYQLEFLGGSYSEDPGKDKPYNAIFRITPDGTVAAKYRKTILLAFGEYVPGGDLFPFLKTIVPEISDFDRGSGPTVIESGSRRFGVMICYEGLFPDFVSDISKKQANIFVNVTNDSWFGRLFEPQQHRIMTLARAIEFRRPLVRSTNTGITSAILAFGTFLETSPLDQEWFTRYDLPYIENPDPTVFSYLAIHVNWFSWLLVLLTLGMAIWKKRSPGI